MNQALELHIAVVRLFRKAVKLAMTRLTSVCGFMPDGVLSSTVLPILYLHAFPSLVCR